MKKQIIAMLPNGKWFRICKCDYSNPSNVLLKLTASTC